jgi:hypothetical protein
LRQRKTVPSEQEGWHPTHEYTLRGICSVPEVVYVCRRAEADLMEMEEPSAPSEEWWKLAYLADDDDPLKVEVRSSLSYVAWERRSN